MGVNIRRASGWRTYKIAFVDFDPSSPVEDFRSDCARDTISWHDDHVLFERCPLFEDLKRQPRMQHAGRGKHDHGSCETPTFIYIRIIPFRESIIEKQMFHAIRTYRDYR